jgi:ABC-type multidrug transport system fused ATPase/permease subunit
VEHTFDMTMYMLVGGIGTLLGPLLGALSVPWLTQYLQFLQEYRFLVFGPILVALVIFLPHGMVGTWLGWRARRAAAARPQQAAPRRPDRRATGRPAVLEIRDVTKRFGGLAAVNAVTTTVERGKVNAIIGPNGAGKTTFFNLVGGTIPPSSGTIVYEGRDITGLRADQVAGWASRAPSRPPRCSTWRRCSTT